KRFECAFVILGCLLFVANRLPQGRRCRLNARVRRCLCQEWGTQRLPLFSMPRLGCSVSPNICVKRQVGLGKSDTRVDVERWRQRLEKKRRVLQAAIRGGCVAEVGKAPLSLYLRQASVAECKLPSKRHIMRGGRQQRIEVLGGTSDQKLSRRKRTRQSDHGVVKLAEN